MATVVILEGDETGQELLREALRVLQPDVAGASLEFVAFDLSLPTRRATRNGVVYEAAEALRGHGVGLKAATITPEGTGDVGSPNAILRDAIDAQVILRTDGAQEWREGSGTDEVAFRTMRIRRKICRIVAEFAFQHARRIGAKVFGGPKFTVSPIYEGMLKEETDAAAVRYPDVPYDPQLIDAVYALLLQSTGEALVIPALNRDGDTLADMVLQMFGSIAGVESLVLSLDDAMRVRTVLAEAPHGTAPRLAGRNIANPMAMILAGAAMLAYVDDTAAQRASRAIDDATFDAVSAGVRTVDLGGEASTTEFTDEAIRRVRERVGVRRGSGGQGT